jgi:Protein of unknown function (DUF3987)
MADETVLVRPATPAETLALTFPASAIVGSLGEFARLMATGTEVPEEFYFAAGITLMGAACVGRLKLKAAIEAEPRFFTVLLGESALVKKSTALRRSAEFFREVSTHSGSFAWPEIEWGAGSAEGLARRLNESQGGVVLLYDEMQSFVQKAKVRSSVLLPMVASLFEQTNWDNPTKAKKSISLRDAHLSLLGCCTTDTYADMWTADAIAIGLPNRLFVVGADRKCKVAWPEARDRGELSALQDRLAKQLARLPLTLDIESDAKRVWEEWYDALQPSEHARRLDAIGFRLMMVLALTTDKARIDLETVKRVLAILDYELRVRVVTDPVNADDRIARLEEKIRRQLKARGSLSERDLRRYCSADREGLWAFRRAIENVRAAKDVSYSPHESKYFLLG